MRPEEKRPLPVSSSRAELLRQISQGASSSQITCFRISSRYVPTPPRADAPLDSSSRGEALRAAGDGLRDGYGCRASPVQRASPRPRVLLFHRTPLRKMAWRPRRPLRPVASATMRGALAASRWAADNGRKAHRHGSKPKRWAIPLPRWEEGKSTLVHGVGTL